VFIMLCSTEFISGALTNHELTYGGGSEIALVRYEELSMRLEWCSDGTRMGPQLKHRLAIGSPIGSWL